MLNIRAIGDKEECISPKLRRKIISRNENTFQWVYVINRQMALNLMLIISNVFYLKTPRSQGLSSSSCPLLTPVEREDERP